MLCIGRFHNYDQQYCLLMAMAINKMVRWHIDHSANNVEGDGDRDGDGDGDGDGDDGGQ